MFSCAIHCCATADILTKLLQLCFLFFIVVVIPGHNLGYSQVSVNRTIGPTLGFFLSENYFFTALKLFSILHGDVCVMAVRRDKKDK